MTRSLPLTRPALIAAVTLIAACVAAAAGIAASKADAAGYNVLRLQQHVVTRGGSSLQTIDGGSRKKGHQGEIDVKNFKLGFNDGCRPLVFKTELNPSWPVLAQLAADTTYDDLVGRLTVVKVGAKPFDARTYQMTGGDIVDVDEQDDIETVTMSYQSLTYSVRTERSGDVTPPITRTINCNPTP